MQIRKILGWFNGWAVEKRTQGANNVLRKNDWCEAVQTRDFAALSFDISSQRIIQHKNYTLHKFIPLITTHISFLAGTNDFFSVSKMKRRRRSPDAGIG